MDSYFRNKNIQDGLVVLILGLALGIRSVYGLCFSTVKASWIMSPYLFPILISVFALCLGISLMLEGKGQVENAHRHGEQPPQREPIKLRCGLYVVGLSVLYYVAMSTLTFIPATVLYLGGMMWLLGERRWKVIAPLSILMPAALYILFALALNVRLP